MRRFIWIWMLGAMLWGVASPSSAVTCAELFAQIGRTYVPDAPGEDTSFGRIKIADCPSKNLNQFVYDVAAHKYAKPVNSLDELLGTWISDDVLGIYAGVFISVYEVLVITPGDGDGMIRVTHKLIRAYDPADWAADVSSAYGGFKVTAAGRIATYGVHLLKMERSGQLLPREVTYFDFPIESDRNTGLAMKRRYMSFLQPTPIDVKINGRTLFLTTFDRMAKGGSRLMSFRKRGDHVPESAMLMSLIGEISMSKFHCFAEAMDTPTPAFTKALGDISRTEFFAALREAERISDENTKLRAAFNDPLLPKSSRDEFTKQAQANIETLIALTENGPLRVLREQAVRSDPFGCPNFY